MKPLPIPTWQERLWACFQWRHRLLNVFGVPSALGAIAAVAISSSLNQDVGVSLGALVATVGSVLYAYYVTAGFDRKLVEQLQKEAAERDQIESNQEIDQIMRNASAEIRGVLNRVLSVHRSIEAVFLDGIDDPVENILQASRKDLADLRNRALQLVNLFGRLDKIISAFDGSWLETELCRIQEEIKRTPEGPVLVSLREAKESTERTLQQWRAAADKKRQVLSVLTIIEKNLQEFKLTMELRKADAVMGSSTTLDVSELQARLQAAGDACDEIVGGNTARRSRSLGPKSSVERRGENAKSPERQREGRKRT